MPYDPSVEHGNAEYRSKIRLPDYITFNEGSDSIPMQDRKYAQLVQVVGSSTSAPVSSAPVQATAVYASYVAISGTYTYIGEAQPGSLTSDPVWRCKRIQDNTSIVITTWADGNANFDNIAANIQALSYS
jgi:hypothetical protein